MTKHRAPALLAAALCTTSLLAGVARADTVAPFGAASAFNLVALGDGGTVAGTIGTSADVGGRVAAAGGVLTGTTIGSSLGADPFGALAHFDLVTPGGLPGGATINVNSHGNAFAPGQGGQINFNGGGHRVTTGSSGIDFADLRSTLTATSAELAALTPNGIVGAALAGANPSWLVLQGTSALRNVFNITAAQFASANNNLDIVAPAGSTVIVNVSGTDVVLGAGLFENGVQHSGDDPAGARVLFNFAHAASVAINGQFDASILAPHALLTGSGQMDGNFIAAAIGQTGEVHNVEFTGLLRSDPATPTPEPNSLLLLGTGLASAAGVLRRRYLA